MATLCILRTHVKCGRTSFSSKVVLESVSYFYSMASAWLGGFLSGRLLDKKSQGSTFRFAHELISSYTVNDCRSGGMVDTRDLKSDRDDSASD